jgi:hypothetical protein
VNLNYKTHLIWPNPQPTLTADGYIITTETKPVILQDKYTPAHLDHDRVACHDSSADGVDDKNKKNADVLLKP